MDCFIISLSLSEVFYSLPAIASRI